MVRPVFFFSIMCRLHARFEAESFALVDLSKQDLSTVMTQLTACPICDCRVLNRAKRIKADAQTFMFLRWSASRVVPPLFF
jgi:hypothetical protein